MSRSIVAVIATLLACSEPSPEPAPAIEARSTPEPVDSPPMLPVAELPSEWPRGPRATHPDFIVASMPVAHPFLAATIDGAKHVVAGGFRAILRRSGLSPAIEHAAQRLPERITAAVRIEGGWLFLTRDRWLYRAAEFLGDATPMFQLPEHGTLAGDGGAAFVGVSGELRLWNGRELVRVPSPGRVIAATVAGEHVIAATGPSSTVESFDRGATWRERLGAPLPARRSDRPVPTPLIGLEPGAFVVPRPNGRRYGITSGAPMVATFGRPARYAISEHEAEWVALSLAQRSRVMWHGALDAIGFGIVQRDGVYVYGLDDWPYRQEFGGEPQRVAIADPGSEPDCDVTRLYDSALVECYSDTTRHFAFRSDGGTLLLADAPLGFSWSTPDGSAIVVLGACADEDETPRYRDGVASFCRVDLATGRTEVVRAEVGEWDFPVAATVDALLFQGSDYPQRRQLARVATGRGTTPIGVPEDIPQGHTVSFDARSDGGFVALWETRSGRLGLVADAGGVRSRFTLPEGATTVRFLDATHAVAVGESSQRMFVSTDAGAAWTRVDVDVAWPLSFLVDREQDCAELRLDPFSALYDVHAECGVSDQVKMRCNATGCLVADTVWIGRTEALASAR